MIYCKHLVIADGHISGYFGGKSVAEYTTPVTPLRWPFIILGLTALIQVSLTIYKKLKSKKMTTLQRLTNTLAENLINVNGMIIYALSCTAVILVFVANVFFMDVDYDIDLFPKSLMIESFFLLFLQLRPFIINPALRWVLKCILTQT